MLKINFKKLGPLSLPNNNWKTADSPGIYLWVEKRGDEQIINYVGKAQTSVRRRNIFHSQNIVNGQYPVPSYYFEGLLNSDSFTNKARKEYIYSDENNLKEFISRAFKYRRNITVFYHLEQVENLRNIEALLINKLSPEENIYQPNFVVQDMHISVEEDNPLAERLNNLINKSS